MKRATRARARLSASAPKAKPIPTDSVRPKPRTPTAACTLAPMPVPDSTTSAATEMVSMIEKPILMVKRFRKILNDIQIETPTLSVTLRKISP